MLRYLKSRLGIPTDPEWKALDRLADAFALPRQWIVCGHCGAWGWRVPPHGFTEPCPLVIQMTETAGLKFDAERSTTIRAGIQMEEITRALRNMTGEEEDE
jgi:hypothetical protein